MGRRLDPRDLSQVRWLSDVQVTSDGSRIACVETRLDDAADGLRSRILVLDATDGRMLGSPGDARSADHSPRWSPDGTRLAFVGIRDGVARVLLADAAGGDAHPIPDGPAGVTALDWAPDGRHLAVSVVRPDPGGISGVWGVAGPEVGADPGPLVRVTVDHYKRDGHPVGAGITTSAIELLAVDGGPSVALTLGRSMDGAPTWSPDGRRIGFLSDRGREGLGSAVVDLWAVEVDPSGRESRPPVRITDGSGPIAAWAWSPDGTRVAVLGSPHGEATGYGSQLQLYAAGRPGTPEVITLAGDPRFALGLTVRSDDLRGMGDAVVRWMHGPDGERLWLRWADGGRAAFGWVALDGTWEAVITGERAMLTASVAAAADVLAFVAADIDQPGEVTVARRDGTGERTISDRNRAWRSDVTLGPTRVVRTTGPGALSVEAWLTLPPADGHGTGPWPMIVSVHGGPHYPVGERFSFETHRLAALGYAVLSPNPRGSLGYGDDFSRAVVGDWGGGDLRDVLALVDAAIETGLVDPVRLAITGVSYGGYLTLWAVTQDQRFRVAIAENGISDLLGTFGTGESGAAWFISEMGGRPWERPDHWLERSPLRHADAVATPVLLLHAELDQNCTIAQSEQMYAALRALGREVAFVRVPGEGHLMDLVGSARFRYARMDLIAGALEETLGEAG